MTQGSDTNDDDTGADAELRPELDDDRVASRAAQPTGEEQRAGSDDPEAQARAILTESEERVLEQADDPEDIERRTSDEATEPI